MARSNGKENSNRSQFFITLRGEDMDQLEGSHTIFGEVAEGLDVLEKLNGLYCDEDGRPYQDVRIRHAYILDDPFPDPDGFPKPSASPVELFPQEEKVKRRIPYEDGLGDTTKTGMTEEELDKSIREKEAKSRAIVLEMTGDLPDADVKPPEEVLFVCKLNSVTTDEDLELIFSRFGKIKSCEVIRDYKTGDSLNYAFIEFETIESCVEAYEKMNNALIDDRRIKVDFSQSVSKLWNRFLLRPRSEQPNAVGTAKPKMNQSTVIGAATGLVSNADNQRRSKGDIYGRNSNGKERFDHNARDRNDRGDRQRESGDYDRKRKWDHRETESRSSDNRRYRDDNGLGRDRHVDGFRGDRYRDNGREKDGSKDGDRERDRHRNRAKDREHKDDRSRKDDRYR